MPLAIITVTPLFDIIENWSSFCNMLAMHGFKLTFEICTKCGTYVDTAVCKEAPLVDYHSYSSKVWRWKIWQIWWMASNSSIASNLFLLTYLLWKLQSIHQSFAHHMPHLSKIFTVLNFLPIAMSQVFCAIWLKSPQRAICKFMYTKIKFYHVFGF